MKIWMVYILRKRKFFNLFSFFIKCSFCSFFSFLLHLSRTKIKWCIKNLSKSFCSFFVTLVKDIVHSTNANGCFLFSFLRMKINLIFCFMDSIRLFLGFQSSQTQNTCISICFLLIFTTVNPKAVNFVYWFWSSWMHFTELHSTKINVNCWTAYGLKRAVKKEWNIAQ